MLPNFFIVGAPKAGTTSLYHHLDQHPQIYMSPIKEPCYFASEIRPENFSHEHQAWASQEPDASEQYLSGDLSQKRFGGMVLDWESYQKLFQNARDETAIGEASVCYLWSQTAAANIAAKIPEARIIMILRDPAERAFSQYLHTVTNGLVRASFREQVETSLHTPHGKYGILHPFLEFGLYSRQVKRYMELFPPENLRVYVYEEDRDRILEDVLRFLKVDPSFRPDESQRHLEPRIPRAIGAGYVLKKYGIWQRAKAWTPQSLKPMLNSIAFRPRKDLAMDPKDREFLVGYYKEDIRELSGVLNRDLCRWLA